MMWMVPIRPEPAGLAAAILAAYPICSKSRVIAAYDLTMRKYSTPLMGRAWSKLILSAYRRVG